MPNNYVDFITNSRQYGVNWLNIQYSQNIFDFNEYKYELRKIRLQEELNRQMLLAANAEDITALVDLIFQNYTEQQMLREQQKNIAKNKELLRQKSVLCKYGKALPSDTLNVFLLLNKLEVAYSEMLAKQQTTLNRLKYKIRVGSDFRISIAEEPVLLYLDSVQLCERYLKYSLQKNADLERFELDSEIARSRRNTGIKTDVSIGAGLNGKTADQIHYLTQNRPADKENISVGVSIPLSGWYTVRNKQKIAVLNKEIYLAEQENNQAEARLWTQEIILKHKRAQHLLTLADKNLQAFQELERILVKNIENGKDSYVALFQLYADYQAALLEKYNAVKSLYTLKYELMQKTFFDFEHNVSLIK